MPSGEGDCASFQTVAEDLSNDFTVLTFDMPGFSRSGPPPVFGKVTATMLAGQVAALVSSLNLAPAAFYGCSSAGLAALSLVAQHPEIVRNAIVHEAALLRDSVPPDAAAALFALNDLDDAAIVNSCRGLFRNQANSDARAWDAVGQDYHRRLEKNYVTWVRHYLWEGLADHTYTQEELECRPISWSVGGLWDSWVVATNAKVARRVHLSVENLPCRHFPQVEIPGLLAARIRTQAKAHLVRT
ncbi:MAG: alpha/beta fold hydrolase [Deltaproteobacteria bacterium]|nr:alpha/beta fold hydrolase [Deltaproteobacteria bacterium]